MTTLTLPYPPSANDYWRSRTGRNGKAYVYVTKEALKYKEAIGKLCEVQGVSALAGSVAVSFVAYRPRKVGDLDNLCKILLDALKGHGYMDDKQIVQIHAWREDDKGNPRVVIQLTPVDGDA